MKVVLEKHGGFTAMRRVPVVVEDTKLTSDERTEFERLVAALRKEAPAPPAANDPGRDAMSYKISVDDQGTTTVYRARDTEMTGTFEQLMQWVEQHADGGAGR